MTTTYMLRRVSIKKWPAMRDVEGTCDMYGIEDMGSSKIVTFISVTLIWSRSSRVRSSEEAQKVNMKCTRKVESVRYLDQVMEFLVGRLQKDIIVALGKRETWIHMGVVKHHTNQCRNENFS